jgi:hypothetical protein
VQTHLSLGEWTRRVLVSLILITFFLALWRLREYFC